LGSLSIEVYLTGLGARTFWDVFNLDGVFFVIIRADFQASRICQTMQKRKYKSKLYMEVYTSNVFKRKIGREANGKQGTQVYDVQKNVFEIGVEIYNCF